MSYYCDMSAISLDKLKSNLKSQRLLPSQQILLDDIESKFETIRKQGISDLQALKNALKNKTKVKEFALITGIGEKYLTVLRRETLSYHPQARKIADFTLIDERIKRKLADIRVKTTEHLFGYVATKEARKKIAEDIGISEEETIMLAKLCDVSRLRYVNPTFAQFLINSSYDTVEKIKSADPITLYEELKEINAEKEYYTGHIGPKDMEFLVRDKPNADIVMEF